MRKTLLVFTTTALALLLAAGTAWAALPAPTVVINTDPAPSGTPPTVLTTANITAKFTDTEGMKAGSINTNTFYLLKGEWTARSVTKNPKRFCFPGVTPPAPPLPTPVACDPANLVSAGTTVSYNAGTLTATLNPFGSSTTLLDPGTKYTVVVEGTGDGDNFAVKDTGGTPLLTAGTGDSIFHFTTAGTGNPGRG
jgi:hypothetical protein